jgi:hypothetical protein
LRHARPVDAVLLTGQASILVVLITILERRGRMASSSRLAERADLGRSPQGAAAVSHHDLKPEIMCAAAPNGRSGIAKTAQIARPGYGTGWPER